MGTGASKQIALVTWYPRANDDKIINSLHKITGIGIHYYGKSLPCCPENFTNFIVTGNEAELYNFKASASLILAQYQANGYTEVRHLNK